MFRYFLYKVGQFLVNVLPLKLAYRFAEFISDLQYTFSYKDRNAVTNNLKIILSDQTKLKWSTREVFRNFGRYLVDFFRMKYTLNHEFIKHHVKLVNVDKFKEVTAYGKGGIVLTAHSGNWELGAAILSVLNLPLMAVALPHNNKLVNQLFNQQRENQGITVVPSNIAVRKCSQWLRDNKFIALVGDRDFGPNGEKLPFLGREAFIPKGPAIFSFKTGAPIIPTFLIRESDTKFILTVNDPIYPPSALEAGDKKEILVNYIKKYIVVIEEMIRRYPEQWLMYREFGVK
ncbi:MAG: lysophospholipid acyltransferase family protein [Candidatus Omnitrophica bacterium]|nr:lysophospholipid acyltransferase family protein [Candidatus Omnitrophota bacterium]MCB9747682.1 lysophospholipid acyltransferase family protein [Candidatus Omnitrophota bacterium]